MFGPWIKANWKWWNRRWVNADIFRISELKRTGMGEFNSDDHYIYYCGQESLRRNGVAIIVNKRVWNAVLGCNLKNDRMIFVHFQHKPFSITEIQCWRNWSWTVLWGPTRPSRINTPKRCSFHYRGLECKSRKSRNTCSNRQILPWSTEWSRVKGSRVLPRQHTGYSKHPVPTTQEKTTHGITRWLSLKSDWLYSL